MLLASILSGLLEMDHIGTEIVGDNTIYTFKTTSLFKSLTEIKAKILSLFDLPMDIPKNVEIQEVKRGRLFKEYIVKITVPRDRIGRLTDLILAKKYPVIPFRRRAYSGEKYG